MLHRRAPARRFLPVLALIATLLGWGHPAFAQEAPDAYTVRDVEVDVTAESAAAARDQAIADAQRKAFEQLYRRLTGPGAPPPPQLGDVEVAELVRNFEVQRERSSAVRYVATLGVSFRPDAMRNLLTGRGIAFAEAPPKPLLVIPVTRQGDTAVLWEERTPWREAWENAAPGDGLIQIVVPYGELADVADLTVEEALSGDPAAFDALVDRYGAGDVLLAVLDVPPGAAEAETGAPAAGRVTLRRFTAAGAEPERTVDLSPAPDQPVEAAWAGAVDTALDEIEAEWKEETIVDAREEHRLRVAVPIGRLDDWIETRQRLAQVPTVARADLKSLSRDRAEIELVFRGDPERFRTALAQRDLELRQTAALGFGPPGAPAEEWQLRWAGAAVP